MTEVKAGEIAAMRQEMDRLATEMAQLQAEDEEPGEAAEKPEETAKELKERMRDVRWRREVLEKLGPGIWGLNREPSGTFSHEEMVFLFARSFQLIGFEKIQKIRTEYPDCIATKNGEDKRIEFEPNSSTFFTHHHDLEKCDCIVCWKHDLPPGSDQRADLRKHGIRVYELSELYEMNRGVGRTQPHEYSEAEIRAFRDKKLAVLSAFIQTGEPLLSKERISQHTGIKGRGLGGALKGYSEQAKKRDWLLRKTSRGW